MHLFCVYTDYMPHIHTDPGQHDHTVSIYLFRTDLGEPKVLLHLHRKAGIYAQFGGHIELDETPWQAATHELEEEAGYKLSEVQLLQPHERMTNVGSAVVHPQPVVHVTMNNYYDQTHFHTDVAYAMIASQPPAEKPAENESAELKLFTRDEIATLEKTDEITRSIALYIFDNCLKKWIPVSPSEFK